MVQTIKYNIDKKISAAIVQLRKQKHQAGYPFMITDEDELPENQAYMEYADGHIKVVEFSQDYRTYNSVKTLNQAETTSLRKKYHLENA